MNSNYSKSPVRKKKYVESYDFKHPKLFSQEIMRTLRTLHEVLARQLGRVFSSGLRQKVEVSLMEIDQLASSEFIRQIDNPSALYLLNVKELGGDVVFVLQPGFCIHLVERQSGGRGSGLSELRVLSTIEEKIISRVMKNVNREIIEAWQPFMNFSIKAMRYESKPENVSMISADPAIVAVYRIELGSEDVEMRIGYPYSLLKESLNESLLHLANHSRKEKLTDEQLKAYEQTLTRVNVRVQPLLGTTRLTINDLINLKEGDTIPLSQKTDQPLEVRVNGVKKMTAYPGSVKSRRAVKIYELQDQINEQELL